jgi:hypothetical protein
LYCIAALFRRRAAGRQEGTEESKTTQPPGKIGLVQIEEAVQAQMTGSHFAVRVFLTEHSLAVLRVRQTDEFNSTEVGSD